MRNKQAQRFFSNTDCEMRKTYFRALRQMGESAMEVQEVRDAKTDNSMIIRSLQKKKRSPRGGRDPKVLERGLLDRHSGISIPMTEQLYKSFFEQTELEFQNALNDAFQFNQQQS